MNVSESYIITVDISEKDEAVVMVGKQFPELEIINVITGEEAKKLYERLTSQKELGLKASFSVIDECIAFKKDVIGIIENVGFNSDKY